MSGDMAGLGRVDKLRAEGGLTVTTASVAAGEVLLHVPPLVTGPGRGGSALQRRSVKYTIRSIVCEASCHHVIRSSCYSVILSVIQEIMTS